MNDNVKIKGHVAVLLLDENNNVKQQMEFDNLITTAGLGAIIDRLQSATAVHDYVGIGSNATAANISDTALGTQLARVQGSMTQPNATTHRVVSTFGAGVGTGTVVEYGLFNDPSAGVLMGHIVTGSIAKGASDSLQVTYDVLVS